MSLCVLLSGCATQALGTLLMIFPSSYERVRRAKDPASRESTTPRNELSTRLSSIESRLHELEKVKQRYHKETKHVVRRPAVFPTPRDLLLADRRSESVDAISSQVTNEISTPPLEEPTDAVSSDSDAE